MDSRYETEDDLKKAVATELRSRGLSSPSDGEWRFIRLWLWEPDYEQSDVIDVVGMLLELRQYVDHPSKRSSVKRPRQRHLTHLYPEAEQNRAEEASRERANRPRVVNPIADFRREVWGSDKPPFDDFAAAVGWLTWNSIPPPLGPLGIRLPSSGVRLEYADSIFGVTSTVVSEDSSLGRLKALSDHLGEVLGCFPSQAVGLVLAGQIPIVWPVTAEFSTGLGPISLHVNYPWVSPGTVQRVYARFNEMRQRLVTESLHRGKETAALVRSLRPRSAALLRFDSATPGLSWSQKHKAWNQQHPDWKYRSDSSMQASLSQLCKRKEKPDKRLARLVDGFRGSEWEQKGYIRIANDFPSSPPIPFPFDITLLRPP